MRYICAAICTLAALVVRAEEPAGNAAAARLTELSKEMEHVAVKLREKKLDAALVGQGSSIERRLAALIVELEGKAGKTESAPKESSARTTKASPLSDERKPESADKEKPAAVESESERWAKLPPAQREEMLQVLRQEMPERWRKRLEAYFMSLADEKAKKPLEK